MFTYDHLIREPAFFLFIAFSFLLTVGYFRGRRHNRKIFISAFNDLMDVIKPDDQTFTNIGGAIGHHATLVIKRRNAPFPRVDATITLLPRQSWLYFPLSKLIRKYDRLFITLHMKGKPPEEVHLIERRHDGFRRSQIADAERLQRDTIKWGRFDFYLYYQSISLRDTVLKFTKDNPDPGTIRHIAIVPEQKHGFIFMIPDLDTVGPYLTPVYRWLPSVIKDPERETGAYNERT